MERIELPPRADWKQRLKDDNFVYFEMDEIPYWREDAAYRFKAAEVDRIEDATNVLHTMCMDHVTDTIKRGSYEKYEFPEFVSQLIESSWKAGEKSVYGRFDLGYDGSAIKLIEYNADTPTSLPEAAVWQWQAMVEDRGFPDQFNSIHDKLIARWKEVRGASRQRIYFTAMSEAGPEDWSNLLYLMSTALDAGYDVSDIPLDQIGWSEERNTFTDLKEAPIEACFKLYPWEFMLADEFGWKLKTASTRFIEPAWKILLSTKALLPLLWEKHKGHPLLLPAHFESDNSPELKTGKWARKPTLSREGANVSLFENGEKKALPGSNENPAYDTKGYVFQKWFDLPSFSAEGYKPIIGSWVVGDTSCGMSIREDTGVTGNTSRFVPHYFE